jgi:hypothetical protein
MLKKLRNWIKQSTCEHIYLPEETLYREVWREQRSVLGYVTDITDYVKLVERKKCVKCDKEKIVETDIPLKSLNKYDL